MFDRGLDEVDLKMTHDHRGWSHPNAEGFHTGAEALELMKEWN